MVTTGLRSRLTGMKVCIVIAAVMMLLCVWAYFPEHTCDQAAKILSGRDYKYIRSGYLEGQPAIYIFRKEGAMSVYNGYVSIMNADGQGEHCRCGFQQYEELLRYHPDLSPDYRQQPL